VEAVIDSLGTTFQALTSGGDSESSAADCWFPVNGFPCESQSYQPLVCLLNRIIDTANQYMPRSQLSELHFQPSGGKVKGLKLDGIGIIGELSTKAKRAKKPAKAPELSGNNRD
jgi:hypothetical protein